MFVCCLVRVTALSRFSLISFFIFSVSSSWIHFYHYKPYAPSSIQRRLNTTIQTICLVIAHSTHSSTHLICRCPRIGAPFQMQHLFGIYCKKDWFHQNDDHFLFSLWRRWCNEIRWMVPLVQFGGKGFHETGFIGFGCYCFAPWKRFIYRPCWSGTLGLYNMKLQVFVCVSVFLVAISKMLRRQKNVLVENKCSCVYECVYLHWGILRSFVLVSHPWYE